MTPTEPEEEDVVEVFSTEDEPPGGFEDDIYTPEGTGDKSEGD